MIDKTAVICDGAKIGDSVKIGAFCFVGGEVVLDSGVELKPHVCIDGNTKIGSGTVIFPFASIGQIPQDLKYAGEKSRVVIGCNNIVRENVTIHSGTKGGRMETLIGNDCLFMASSHIAHDCIVGNNVIIANCGTLGGHVVVGNHVVIGGLSAIHQFVRIGDHAMIGGMSGITNDVVPYAVAIGNRAELAGVNLIGLRRRGFSKASIANIQKAFAILFQNGQNNFMEKIDKIKNELYEDEAVKLLLDFIYQDTNRQLLM